VREVDVVKGRLRIELSQFDSDVQSGGGGAQVHRSVLPCRRKGYIKYKSVSAVLKGQRKYD